MWSKRWRVSVFIYELRVLKANIKLEYWLISVYTTLSRCQPPLQAPSAIFGGHAACMSLWFFRTSWPNNQFSRGKSFLNYGHMQYNQQQRQRQQQQPIYYPNS